MLGCDEFASTLFSLGNLAGVVIGFMRAQSTKRSIFSSMLRFHAISSSVVWVLSGIFNEFQNLTFSGQINFPAVFFLPQVCFLLKNEFSTISRARYRIIGTIGLFWRNSSRLLYFYHRLCASTISFWFHQLVTSTTIDVFYSSHLLLVLHPAQVQFWTQYASLCFLGIMYSLWVYWLLSKI